jgi:hypothetical protein
MLVPRVVLLLLCWGVAREGLRYTADLKQQPQL